MNHPQNSSSLGFRALRRWLANVPVRAGCEPGPGPLWLSRPRGSRSGPARRRTSGSARYDGRRFTGSVKPGNPAICRDMGTGMGKRRLSRRRVRPLARGSQGIPGNPWIPHEQERSRLRRRFYAIPAFSAAPTSRDTHTRRSSQHRTDGSPMRTHKPSPLAKNRGGASPHPRQHNTRRGLHAPSPLKT